MLNLVREGEEDYIEAIRYRRRLKIFENFLFLRCFILVNGLVLNITRNKNFETLHSSDSSASYSMNIQIKKIYLWLRAIDVAK